MLSGKFSRTQRVRLGDRCEVELYLYYLYRPTIDAFSLITRVHWSSSRSTRSVLTAAVCNYATTQHSSPMLSLTDGCQAVDCWLSLLAVSSNNVHVDRLVLMW